MAMRGLSVVEDDLLLAPAGQDPVHVELCLGERNRVQRISRRLFGRMFSGRHWAALCGAPHGSNVEVGVYQGRLYLDFSDPRTHRYRGVVCIVSRRGRLVLVIEGLHVHPTLSRGHGLGLSIFAGQLAAAEMFGIDRIETRAGRCADENGYYTWPRYGFDGRLPDVLCRRLPAALNDAIDVLDLMESPSGRAWWRLFGIPMDMRFEVHKNSRSQKAFERYCTHREQRR